MAKHLWRQHVPYLLLAPRPKQLVTTNNTAKLAHRNAEDAVMPRRSNTAKAGRHSYNGIVALQTLYSRYGVNIKI